MKKTLLIGFVFCMSFQLTARRAQPVDSIRLQMICNCGDSTNKVSGTLYTFHDTVSAAAPPVPTTPSGTTTSPSELLTALLIGALLGMAGQTARTIIGLKKTGQVAADNNLSTKSLIDGQQTVISLLIGLFIGATAGILAALNSPQAMMEKSTLLAILAAGYAGTDFIEGAFRRQETHARVKEKIQADAQNAQATATTPVTPITTTTTTPNTTT